MLLHNDSRRRRITKPCFCAAKKPETLLELINKTTKAESYGQPSNPNKPRPTDVEKVIRETAELALREMAVVICGPVGLAQSMWNSAVTVSHDRAVHKVTGAQGVYVHAEMIGSYVSVDRL